MGESVALTTGSASDRQSTNDRKVAGSRPTKVVCITVLTGNRMGWTVRCGRPPLLLPSCRKLEFRLSALMDSDLAWVNGKSGRQSWRFPALCNIGSQLPFMSHRKKYTLAISPMPDFTVRFNGRKDSVTGSGIAGELTSLHNPGNGIRLIWNKKAVLSQRWPRDACYISR